MHFANCAVLAAVLLLL